MATCLVIQPFDAGKFDRRYREIFKPAIEAAGFERERTKRDRSDKKESERRREWNWDRGRKKF